MTFEELINRFQVKSRKGNSVQCLCPAHSDNKASLTISEEKGKILLHCHAGCDTGSVLEAVGLSMKDLYTNEEKQIERVYPYRNIETGKVEFERVRFYPKSFAYRVGNKYGLNRNRKDIPAIYGDLEKIKKAQTVYYCEGEKDVDTAYKHGLTAFTCGSSSDYTALINPLLEGKKVVIFQDNDEAGRKQSEFITESLKGIARTRVIVPSSKEKGDLTDYFQDGGTVEGLFKSRLQTVAQIEEQEVHWLIDGYIPKGQITLLAGDGGEGKTAVWCNLVAGITTGKRTILDCDNPFDADAENVLFFSSEDSVPKVLKKRLRNAGADENRIKFIDMADAYFSKIKFNSVELEEIIEEERPSLVVFDPLQSFIPADVQMGSRNAMRQTIAPLVVMGEKYGTTFLIVMHTNKKTNAFGRTRCADSADVWDQARAVLIAGSTGEPGEHYLSLEKSNYGGDKPTILYRIDNGCVEYQGTSDKHDKDYMQENGKMVRAAPARDEAKQIILKLLEDGNEHKVSEIDEALKAQGVTFATLKRSKSELKKDGLIEYRVEGGTENKVFYVKLCQRVII
jgi:archaellum biogenesis ATPase FlaH/DNA-binding transcriptional ArsR family regulator